MSTLHVATIAMTARATIPDYAFEQQFPSSLDTLGMQLARQVHDYVKQQQIGYYPALDFIKQQNCVEPFLFDALEQVAEFAMAMSEREIYSLLSPVFSNVVIESMQLIAYTMPVVRFAKDGDIAELARHFTPNAIKFDLHVSMIQKHEPSKTLDKAAKQMVLRWLSEPFKEIEVTSSRLL